MSWYGGGSRIIETVDDNMQGPESAETLYTKQKSSLWSLLDTFSEEKMKYVNFLAEQIWLDLKDSKNNKFPMPVDKLLKQLSKQLEQCLYFLFPK